MASDQSARIPVASERGGSWQRHIVMGRLPLAIYGFQTNRAHIILVALICSRVETASTNMALRDSYSVPMLIDIDAIVVIAAGWAAQP